ncbi:MAG: hypothetical protein AAFX09_00455 [Pseudomonadota bacterium]
MADAAMNPSVETAPEPKTRGFGPEAFTWVGAGVAALAALASHPSSAVLGVAPVAGAAGGAPAVLSMALLAFMLGWIGDIATRRLSGVSEFLVSAVCWAGVGASFVLAFDPFSRMAFDGVFVRSVTTLEFVGLWTGGLLALLGVALVGALSAAARESAEVTKREQRQIVAAMPALIGEGVLLVLLALARPLDWTAPGPFHAGLLFLAGAAIFAAVWFTFASLAKLDELERNLSYRQTTVCFMVYFFFVAAWALGEAVGIAPALDAYAAFLLLVLISLVIALPWTLWAMREEE